MQSHTDIASAAAESGVRRRPKLCIIGLEDYPHLLGRRQIDMIGGPSVQDLLLSSAWRAMGLDVSIIVFDEGQPRVHEIDGIRVIASCRRDDGVPGLRFIYPRGTSLLAAMRLADADVYFQSNAGYVTGLTAWFCRRYARRFVFRVSSDAYCVPGRQLIRLYWDRKIYEYGLRRADLILAQTETQRRLLRTHYGLDSELANMAVEQPARAAKSRDIDVLWVGTLRAVKRPDLVIELARRLPHLKFVVAGGARREGEQYAHRMREAAGQLANLTYLGAVPYHAVGEYFDRARVFLNTSKFEGFPNTFLQAWIRGLPVVTFFDPDGLVANKQVGVVPRDPDEMTRALDELARQETLREAMGRRAAAFAADEYSADVVAKRYLELFARRFAESTRLPQQPAAKQGNRNIRRRA